MRTANNLLQAMEKINLNEIIQEGLQQSSPTYLQQQKEQMSFSANQKGETIGKYRSQEYARKKNQMNPDAGFGNVDLRLTGSFYGAMEASADPAGMNIDSTDQKSGMLKQKYGPEIFGLFGEWKEPFTEELHKDTTQLLINELNQK